ncbi:hypothetical protein OIU85_000386, partial [Salix viminalis]
LDVGDGKEVEVEECPRSKLQENSIKYLGPKEREQYECIIIEGRFFHKQSRNLVDTKGKWIFVLSPTRRLNPRKFVLEDLQGHLTADKIPACYQSCRNQKSGQEGQKSSHKNICLDNLCLKDIQSHLEHGEDHQIQIVLDMRDPNKRIHSSESKLENNFTTDSRLFLQCNLMRSRLSDTVLILGRNSGSSSVQLSEI